VKRPGKIGFGTTSLLALSSERDRQTLLCRALESGITHFDTAPYYGYGEAEKILGRFIKSRRDEVTITTKFGIQPPRLAGSGSVAGAVKRLVKNLGPVRKLLARQASKMVQRAAFSAVDAEKSLENSLRSLQTDHVDIYLLHEAGPEDTSEELLAFLEVLQFDNSVLTPNIQRLTATPDSWLAITHGALGGSFRQLRDALQANDALRRRCCEALAVDVGNSHQLTSAMLSWAVLNNARGMVLFSSSRSANVRANMEAMRGGRFTSEQLKEFERLVTAHSPKKEKED